MFERFDDSARRAVVLAMEQARLLGHDWIGTEHLLLGVLAVEGPESDALEQWGVSLEAVRDQVEEMRGPVDHPPRRDIPFTPRAKEVLELSLREALRLGDRAIGTAHVLLGLLREGQGMACQILVALHVDLGALRLAAEVGLRGTGRPGVASLGLDDAGAVLRCLREALGEDVALHSLVVRSLDEVHLLVAGPRNPEPYAAVAVRQGDRWVIDRR